MAPSTGGGSRGVPPGDDLLAPETPRANASAFPPFIQGLLDSLPEPNTNWTIEARAKWLQTAAHCFDLMYKGDGSIHITAKSEQSQ